MFDKINRYIIGLKERGRTSSDIDPYDAFVAETWLPFPKDMRMAIREVMRKQFPGRCRPVPRLTVSVGTRPDDEVIPRVFTAKDSEASIKLFEETAIKMRQQAQTQMSGPSVEMSAKPRNEDSVPLLQWGIFNPFGPTITTVATGLVPSTQEVLYFCVQDHFLYPRAYAIRLISNEEFIANHMNSGTRLLPLEPVFVANGTDSDPLFNCLPHYVSVLGPSEEYTARSLFLAAYKAIASKVVIREECEQLQRHWKNPWNLATSEMDGAVKRLRSRSDHGYRDNQNIDEDSFNLWFALASDLDHVISYQCQMPFAWQGAKDFMKRRA